MSLTKISEKFVLNKLKDISQGNLKLINYDGKVFHFGDLESKLSTDIKVNNPSFYYSGSSTNPEAYSLAKLNNTNGFFSEYAKYSISEDMAETFSFINSREKYVSEVINLDKILNKKVIFIKEGMSNIEKSL